MATKPVQFISYVEYNIGDRLAALVEPLSQWSCTLWIFAGLFGHTDADGNSSISPLSRQATKCCLVDLWSYLQQEVVHLIIMFTILIKVVIYL